MNKEISKIALLGTSADPPTIGHHSLLIGLLKIFPRVVTWASDNPMKTHQVSLQKRIQLLKVLVKTINNPSLELVQEISSPWTITTLERARNKWPRQELVFIIGSDLISEITSWVETKSLLKKARIGIAPRKGCPIDSKAIKELKELGGKIDLLSLEIPDSSSSNVRKNSLKSNIPSSLLPLIRKENLYGIAESD
tara:strand:- start:1387 stop:1971 length:585 start_codon:yes stop_codon:yes gene_type:complete